MASWQIVNTASGVIMGVYEGKTREEALDAMSMDDGYADHATACEATGSDGSELQVTRLTHRLVVDWENNADTWWEAAHESDTAPAFAAEWIHSTPRTGLEVTKAQADEFRGWAASLPGWSDGPAYARHPVLFQEV